MTSQPPRRMTRRTRRGLIAGMILGLVAVAVLGGWAYLRSSRQDTAGLEGTWRDPNNPRHRYEFERDGELACWFGPKDWWNRIGWEATWRRDGDRIIIRTDRNWDLDGRLDGDTIRGTMRTRDASGVVVGTTEVVWQKE